MGSETTEPPIRTGFAREMMAVRPANLKDHDRLLRQMLRIGRFRQILSHRLAKSYLGCRDSVGKKAFQPMEQLLLRVTCPAFPDHQNLPTVLLKLAAIPSISIDVALPLGLPELGVRRWHDTTVSTPVTMPEAPVDENHLPSSPEDQVRLPGQASIMQPISITHRMHDGSDNHLGLRVFRPNPRHVERSLRFGMNIHEGMTNDNKDKDKVERQKMKLPILQARRASECVSIVTHSLARRACTEQLPVT